MRKNIREIEIAGLIMAAIGIICSMVWGAAFGAWACGFGLLLLLLVFLYEYFRIKLAEVLF